MSAPRSRPDASEYAEFYRGYIAHVPEGDIVELLRENGRVVDATLATVPEARGTFRYAENKWSIRDVIGHLADAERIFTYRALRVARGDATPLPGFDENSYAAAANADARPLADLRADFRVVRESTLHLFSSLDDAAWTRTGIANAQPVSVRAIAYVTVGHAAHHLRILAERYGVTPRL